MLPLNRRHTGLHTGLRLRLHVLSVRTHQRTDALRLTLLCAEVSGGGLLHGLQLCRVGGEMALHRLTL